MLKCLCAAILVTSLSGQTIQEIDEQFRAEVLEILPEDYASISIGLFLEEAVVIADVIYSPHAEMLSELGYDPDAAQKLFDMDGAASLWCFWKAFDPYSVERILADHPGYVIDMGGGSTVHEHDDQLERVKRVLAPYRNVVLLLPYPDREASLEFLDRRTGWGDKERNVNRNILEHRSNYQLATMTVYTAERSPEEIAEEILEMIQASDECVIIDAGQL